MQNSNELAYSVSSSLSYTINGNTISRYTSNDNVKEHLNQKLVSREAITTINNINDFSLSYEAFIKKSHDDITVKVLSTSDLIDSELIKNARDQSKISDLLDMKKYSIETYPTLSEMQNFFDRAKIYHNPASTRLKYIFTFDSSEENNLPQIVTNLDPSKILTYEANVYLSEKLKIEKDEEIAELKTRLSKYEEMQTMLVKELEQLKSDQQNFKVQIVKSEVGNQ
ncbi:MAG: hypothetical protein EDM72_01180 [Chlorobiota bacterium]|nr:MAG: hypothetical protein EDM72_01180 [Chlorobiota bacterium]